MLAPIHSDCHRPLDRSSTDITTFRFPQKGIKSENDSLGLYSYHLAHTACKVLPPPPPLSPSSTLTHVHTQAHVPYSTMSDLTASVTKDVKGSITVEGYEALKYNFHYVSHVFDVQHAKLAEIYERWGRVLIVIDTSEFRGFSPDRPRACYWKRSRSNAYPS